MKNETVSVVSNRLKRCWVVGVSGLLLLACAACNTTEGVGKDIKAAGRGIENAADKAN